MKRVDYETENSVGYYLVANNFDVNTLRGEAAMPPTGVTFKSGKGLTANCETCAGKDTCSEKQKQNLECEDKLLPAGFLSREYAADGTPLAGQDIKREYADDIKEPILMVEEE